LKGGDNGDADNGPKGVKISIIKTKKKVKRGKSNDYFKDKESKNSQRRQSSSRRKEKATKGRVSERKTRKCGKGRRREEKSLARPSASEHKIKHDHTTREHAR